MSENRGPTDDKIFEMHGTLATLTESGSVAIDRGGL